MPVPAALLDFHYSAIASVAEGIPAPSVLQQWENIQLKQEEEERGGVGGLVAPFPAPKTGVGGEVTSPADSVFSQQDSISSTGD